MEKIVTILCLHIIKDTFHHCLDCAVPWNKSLLQYLNIPLLYELVGGRRISTEQDEDQGRKYIKTEDGLD